MAKEEVNESIIKYFQTEKKNAEAGAKLWKGKIDKATIVTDEMVSTFERLSAKVEGIGDLDDVHNLAQIVSSKLGEEEALTRELSHQMSLMFKEDKDLRVSYTKADKETQAEMMLQMRQIATDRLRLTDAQLEKYAHSMDTALDNMENNIDDVIAKSEKMLFPIGTEMLRALDGFRHNIVERFPKTLGRFFSDAMMEHYKTGVKEIAGHFKTHMQTIMAPMEAITGPLIAISKSMFTMGKTLFSGPTKHEKETAKVQREIRDTLKGARKDERKKWIETKKQQAKEAARSVYKSVKDDGIFATIKKIGPMLMTLFTAIGSFVSTMLLPAIPIIATIVSVGKVVYNLFKDFDQLSAMFMDGDWAGFGRLLAADILDGLLMLPEMIINGALSLMGSDFRVDFGKDAILEAIDNMTQWVFDSITVPLGDFFTITLPEAFSSVSDGLMSLFAMFNPITIGQKLWNTIVDNLATLLDSSSIPFAGGLAESLRGMKADVGANTAGVSPSKSVAPKPSTTSANTAKAEQIKQQIEVQKATQKELAQANDNLTQNNNQQQIIIQNMQNNSTERPSDIPTDNADLGIMFNNSVYGA